MKFELIRKRIKGNTIYSVFSVYHEGSIILQKQAIERMSKRIPKGVYDIKFEYSPRFKRDLWELKGVKDRSEIKIHPANYAYQLRGCIAIGNSIKDGVLRESKKALEQFHQITSGIKSSKITIKEDYESVTP